MEINLKIKLTLFLIGCFTHQTTYAEKSKCDVYANKLADDFQIRAKLAVSNFEEDINKIRTVYINRNNNLAGETFDKYVKTQKFINSYNYWESYYYDKYPEIIRGYSSSKKQYYCKSFDWFKENVNKKMVQFQDKLILIVKFIDERIELENLDTSEGYAVISASFNQQVKNIQLKSKSLFRGSLDIGPINQPTYFRVIKLKAGEYYWNRIRLFSPLNTFRYYEFGSNDMSFIIRPGKINLTGTLIYRKIGDRASADITDRSALILKILRQNYPDLIDDFEWVNAFSLSDPFVAFYQDQLELIQ